MRGSSQSLIVSQGNEKYLCLYIDDLRQAMAVLRMIKLFGWQRRVQQDIVEKREEELKWIWKRMVRTESCYLDPY